MLYVCPTGLPMIEALIPTITALGAGYALFDYKKRRFSSPEDRYMRMYGKDEWSSNDMNMYLRFDPQYDDHVKTVWKQRLDEQLQKNPEPFCEIAEISGVDLRYRIVPTTVADLLQPRNGHVVAICALPALCNAGFTSTCCNIGCN